MHSFFSSLLINRLYQPLLTSEKRTVLSAKITKAKYLESYLFHLSSVDVTDAFN